MAAFYDGNTGGGGASSAGPAAKFQYKVVLLGEGCVGKTSLVVRYVQNSFNDTHLTTLQASFLNKKLNIAGKRVELAIWDTAGQERFHALGPIYYRDSNGAVLVYDITDEDSFQKVKNWVKELRKMLGPDIALAIVGNKTDLEKDRNVAVAEAEEYSKAVGAVHYHTSAKLNKGIEEMFLDLSKRMLEQTQRTQAGGITVGNTPAGFSGRQSRRNIIIDDDAVGGEHKKSCC